MRIMRLGQEGTILKEYQLECDTCFSFLVVNISDLKKNHLINGSFFIFRCPVCGYESYISIIDLEKQEIPVIKTRHL